jgi:acyl transferase domain-containing protein
MAEPEPIAIVGIGCRLPGSVGSPEDLWQLLSKGQSGWSRVPTDRWNSESFYHPDGGSIQAYNAQSGYFLTHDVAEFDSRFFGFTSHEADAADPQQRLLLETTYEALENAGIPLKSLRGSDTAVYAAVFARDYDRMQYKDVNNISHLHIGGTGEAILANRLSYVFDWKGASMTIDTGCVSFLLPPCSARHVVASLAYKLTLRSLGVWWPCMKHVLPSEPGKQEWPSWAERSCC